VVTGVEQSTLTVPPFVVQSGIRVVPAVLKLPYTTNFFTFAIAQLLQYTASGSPVTGSTLLVGKLAIYRAALRTDLLRVVCADNASPKSTLPAMRDIATGTTIAVSTKAEPDEQCASRKKNSNKGFI
jgi:hypothetical protein